MFKILFTNSDGHKFVAVIDVDSEKEAIEIFRKEISNVTIESIYHVTRNMTVIPWGRR